MPKDFVRFDEIEDVLSSVDLVETIVPLLKQHPSYWKWTIIAAHSGLQGAMVCALSDTSGVSVLNEKSARKWNKWYLHKKGDWPEERLADFNVLLTRCQENGYMQGQPLKLGSSQLADIERLHEHFRNNFVHFVPKGWSIERGGLPRITGAAMDALETLMQHPNVDRKITGNRKHRLTRSLADIRKGLLA